MNELADAAKRELRLMTTPAFSFRRALRRNDRRWESRKDLDEMRARRVIPNQDGKP